VVNLADLVMLGDRILGGLVELRFLQDFNSSGLSEYFRQDEFPWHAANLLNSQKVFEK
jgi:hypothetical protein